MNETFDEVWNAPEEQRVFNPDDLPPVFKVNPDGDFCVTHKVLRLNTPEVQPNVVFQGPSLVFKVNADGTMEGDPAAVLEQFPEHDPFRPLLVAIVNLRKQIDDLQQALTGPAMAIKLFLALTSDDGRAVTWHAKWTAHHNMEQVAALTGIGKEPQDALFALRCVTLAHLNKNSQAA